MNYSVLMLTALIVSSRQKWETVKCLYAILPRGDEKATAFIAYDSLRNETFLQWPFIFRSSLSRPEFFFIPHVRQVDRYRQSTHTKRERKRWL